jgi:hypothetical protein
MRGAAGDLDEIFGRDSLERLVPVAGFRRRSGLAPEEYLALETAEEHRAHYVYFRDNVERPSPTRTAQAYVYDLTRGPLFAGVDWGDLSGLHKQLWNACPVPLFIVILHAEIRIFSSLKAPEVTGRTVRASPLEVIKLAAKTQRGIDLFRGRLRDLDIGTFWDNPSNRHLREAKREHTVYGLMLQQLCDTRRRLIRLGKLSRRHANRLLMMALLVRYLEERTDSEGRGVFPKAGEVRNGKTCERGFFEEFARGARDFTSVVRSRGRLVALFDNLSRRFNGDAFDLTEEERTYVSQADLSGLADFLAGQPGGQPVFWPLYSFNHLPVELISNVYEEFLLADTEEPQSNGVASGSDGRSRKRRQGIVYTPPYLVDFLLAESMPLVGPFDFRILDPACGSGVFLVAAYRRLIARWRLGNGWRHPDLGTLRTLLGRNIYGVDLDADAVSLTVLSLYIALCSELEPMEIWQDLRFERLKGTNIRKGDFFQEVDAGTWSKPETRFDLIIGNPPFSEKLSPAAAAVNDRAVMAGNRPELPNKQVALLFLDQSMALLKPGGMACLIQPAAPLLYNQGAHDFRRAFFQLYDVPQVLDFTHACRVVFGPGGDVAFAAVFARRSRPSPRLLHVTVRRTRSAKEHVAFELDRYDFHLVSQQAALDEPSVWKANLIGGGRMVHLARRLSSIPKLKDYLALKGDGWEWGEGFIVSSKANVRRYEALLEGRNRHDEREAAELRELEQECRTAPFITGKPFLPTHALGSRGVDDAELTTVEARYFHSTGPEAIYKEPHVLFAERAYENGIPIEFRDDYLTFKHDIFAIHAPSAEAPELQRIEQAFKGNRTMIFALLLTSGRFAVNKSSATLALDLLNLPYPQPPSDLHLNEWESILCEDALDFWLDGRRRGEVSRVMRNAEDEDLRAFGTTFAEFVGSVYPGLKADDPRETATHICYPFYFKRRPDLPASLTTDLDQALDEITRRHHRPSVRVTRILRIYERDAIYLIKPKLRRYWLRSVAIRDADDTFAEMAGQGL